MLDYQRALPSGEGFRAQHLTVKLLLAMGEFQLRKDCGHSNKSHAASSASRNPCTFLDLEQVLCQEFVPRS